MFRHVLCITVFAHLAAIPSSPTFAQFGGSRAGVENSKQNPAVPSLPRLEKEDANSFITIDGRAELRLRPTQIRVVLAVTSEAETAQECQTKIDATIKKLKTAWAAIKIPPKDIVEDFIAVIPRYEWKLEKREGAEVGIENRVGFRMQTNIHLSVPNDAKAPAAFKAAFEQGITDIIAFDYWSRELDDAKSRAREKAVTAARTKADILLKALFEKKPPVINVQEQTTVRYPASLYKSFVNSYDQAVRPSWRRDIPFIHAPRPRNTYYRGLFVDGDIQARELPMHPEISIISTVRLYFQSPAADAKEKKKK